MAFLNRTEIGLKKTSSKCTVPDDPTAQLMYYLDCVCTLIGMDDDRDISRLRRYSNYRSLDRSDKKRLVALCGLLNPIFLINKCMFKNDRLCGDSTNAFYDLETVRNNLMVAGSVVIGGRQRRVNKIMTFKDSWLSSSWERPMDALMHLLE